jgi:RNA polymerase sigma factor (TIGR02999 family)
MSNPNGESDPPPADRQKSEELLPVLYAELRRLAASLSQKLRPGQTLQPTALVHEAYMQLAKNDAGGWEGRRHFFGAAALAMRNILVDQARARAAQKRGGDRDRVELADGVAYIVPPADDLLALDDALTKMQAEKPHLAELVMLRYYSGLSVQEAAEVLGRSESTLTREWRFARAWLARELGAAPGE